MTNKIHPVFTKEFKMGYDAGKEHQAHNAEVRAKREYGAALTEKLTTLKNIEGVGEALEKRIIKHFGGL